MRYGILICVVTVCMILQACTTINSVTISQGFTWTAPGDDGGIGTAAEYDMRYTLDDNRLWEEWVTLAGEPVPSIAGTAESCFVLLDVFTDTPYYFGIKTVDDAGNWSLISNIVEIVFADTIAPSPIIDYEDI